jgi:hypothetical protein
MGKLTCAPGCPANPPVAMAAPPCFTCVAPATGG